MRTHAGHTHTGRTGHTDARGFGGRSGRPMVAAALAALAGLSPLAQAGPEAFRVLQERRSAGEAGPAAPGGAKRWTWSWSTKADDAPGLGTPRAGAGAGGGAGGSAEVEVEVQDEPPPVMLGISLSMPDALLARHLKLPKGAVVVGGVAEGLPAGKAGVQVDDIVTAIDGVPLSHPNQLGEVLRTRKPKDTALLTLLRDGASREVRVVLEAFDASRLTPGLPGAAGAWSGAWPGAWSGAWSGAGAENGAGGGAGGPSPDADGGSPYSPYTMRFEFHGAEPEVRAQVEKELRESLKSSGLPAEKIDEIVGRAMESMSALSGLGMGGLQPGMESGMGGGPWFMLNNDRLFRVTDDYFAALRKQAEDLQGKAGAMRPELEAQVGAQIGARMAELEARMAEFDARWGRMEALFEKLVNQLTEKEGSPTQVAGEAGAEGAGKKPAPKRP